MKTWVRLVAGAGLTVGRAPAGGGWRWRRRRRQLERGHEEGAQGVRLGDGVVGEQGKGHHGEDERAVEHERRQEHRTPAADVALRVCEHRIVHSLAGLRQLSRRFGQWVGQVPDDSILALRDTSLDEVFALEPE